MLRPGHAVFGAGLIVFSVLMSPVVFGLLFFESDFFYIEVGHRCAWDAAKAAGSFGLDGIYGTVGNGVPIWAHPSSQLFYPPRWLTTSFSPQLGAHLDVVMHLSAAASASAWLLLKFRSRPSVALAGALTWVLSGSVLDLITKSETTIVALWLPLAWAAVRCALYDRADWGWSLTGLAVGLSFLGGDPLCAILIGSVAIVEIFARPGPKANRSWRVWATGLAAGVGGLFIGLLQWLPTLSEVSLGRRGEGLPADEVLVWSFLPNLWPAAVAPGSLRAQGTDAWLALHTIESTPSWNEQPYFGWFPILAACFAVGHVLHRRQRRWWLAPSILVVTWFLFATANLWPGAATLTELVPGAATLRYPMKLLPAVGLAAVVLLTIQQRRWRRFTAETELRRFLIVGGVLVLALGLGLTVIAFTVDELDSVTAAAGWWRTVLLGALPLGVSWLLLRRGRVAWVPLVVVVDAMLLLPQHLMVGPPIAEMEVTPLRNLKEVSERPVICRAKAIETIKINSDSWSGQVVQRFWAVPEVTSCDGLISPYPYTVPLASRTALALSSLLNDPDQALTAARALGCTHFIAPFSPLGAKQNDAATLTEGEDNPKEPKAWRVPGAFSGAAIVSAPGLVEESEVLSKVMAASGQAQTLAVVDDPDHRLPVGTVLHSTSNGAARVEGIGGSNIVLKVAGKGSAVVAISQAYARGWSAIQAGQVLPLVRVSGQLLGVVIAQTESGAVELRYRAPHKRWALISGFVGLLSLCALWAFLRRRKVGPRRAQPKPAL